MTKIITIYFNGSNESDKIPELGTISLATLLNAITKQDKDHHYSFCITGCNIDNHDYRDLGIVFTFNLQRQVMEVLARIKKIIAEAGQEPIQINLFGFSRGAIAVFWVSQLLKEFKNVKINLVALDPVPGNLISTAFLDQILGIDMSVSSAVANLTECDNLDKALILFTNEAHPDLACYAPLLPALPSQCKAEVDVTPGRHRGAAMYKKQANYIAPMNYESTIVFNRIVRFMEECGTKFNFNRFNLHNQLKLPNESLIPIYNTLITKILEKNNQPIREMHNSNRITTSLTNRVAANHHHFKLLGKQQERFADFYCLLTIKDRYPQPISPYYRQVAQFVELMLFMTFMYWLCNQLVGEQEPSSQYRP